MMTMHNKKTFLKVLFLSSQFYCFLGQIFNDSDKSKKDCNGWHKFRKSCYKYYYFSEYFDSAQATCYDNNAHLVSILDTRENNFVIDLISSKFAGSVSWIGLRNFSFTFEWIDKQNITFSNLTVYGEGKCVMIDASKVWKSTVCDVKLPFVCKRGSLDLMSDNFDFAVIISLVCISAIIVFVLYAFCKINRPIWFYQIYAKFRQLFCCMFT
ncbi:snaclec coagulation factor X-activating enzyme light chain 1 isoform X2 [Hydra vulgaris]|uniref:Snaclec coagulation factor X-activating enzyme light chain 1 isoform X2 n=1 Tax=Hydra vulgaris TaxID=6087 RepID=A0ABM4BG17_HYDVU